MSEKLGVDQISNRSSSRSVSPGSRIKDAFKPKSRRSSPSKDGKADGEREGRPDTRDGERPQSQRGQRPPTRGSTSSLPMSITSNGTDTSIPPVPPIPSSPPMIAINGAGLNSKPSLNSILVNSGTPGKSPATTVTPPTPVASVDENAPKTPSSPRQTSRPSSSSNSPTPAVSAHRRTRSDSSTKQPSKLSQSMNAPLTPTQEEPPGIGRNRNVSNTSSGSAGSGAGGGGFFSSMFSAAQNMTNSFTSIGGGGAARPRTGTTGSAPEMIPEEREEAEARATHSDESGAGAEGGDEAATTPKELAIDTIGSGNLSLSHLGIVTDSPQSMSSPSAAGGNRSRSGTQVKHEEAQAQAEDASAARAVSAAYDNALNPLDRPATAVAEDVGPVLSTQASSIYEGSFTAKTPPNGSIYEGEPGGVYRSGSLRDKIVSGKRRKHRNSSGTTIGAAIAASHGTLASPGRNSSSQKLDGFTYANKKRDKDYHQLFRSVPEDDHLLDDYSCALQRDIILAGRIYVSEGHICFSSNILGWVTNLIISFDEIVAVDKESTAMVFPNAIAIQTLHARHTFRSLLSREATYDLMISIWKTSHPNLQSTETGTKLLSPADAAAAAAAAAEKAEHDLSGSDSDEDDDDDDSEDGEDGDSDDDDDGETASIPSKPASIAGGEAAGGSGNNGAAAAAAGAANQTSPIRRVSTLAQEAGAATAPGPLGASNGAAVAAASGAAAVAEKDYPGPASHAPTECTDAASHYENVLKDDTVSAPLGKIYSMVFGPASGVFMSNWLKDVAKCWDIEVEGGGPLKGLDNDVKSRSFTYIKPLNAPIGPKQTKCIVTEQVDAFDLDKAVSITVTTQTPDVPSGNVFGVKTRYCFMWGPNNSTKIHISYTVEWTGKSWIKGPIEKGAKDGQATYTDDLVAALRQGVTSGSRGRAGSKAKKGKKRKGGDGARSGGDGAGSGGARGSGKKEEPNWGLLEPIRPILGPVFEPIAPLFSPTMIIAFLSFLLIVSWFRNSRARVAMRDADAASLSRYGLHGGPLSQLRAGGHHGFEQAWRNEEDALWAWLEQRVGLQDGVPGSVGGKKVAATKSNADSSKQARRDRRAVLAGRAKGAAAALADVGGMSKREIEYALRVTEEKLDALKRIVGTQGVVAGEDTDENGDSGAAPEASS